MTGDKFRFRFAKSGTLRLVSHHDLMRCAERMLRRAALPFKSTAGFHPTPRLVFALSLPLGVVGRDEVVELELAEPRDSEEVRAALNAQAPVGLSFTCASVVPMKATARVRRVAYELPLPPERVAQVEAAAAALLAEPKVWVERLRPSAKRLNIRPYVRNASVERGAASGFAGVSTCAAREAACGSGQGGVGEGYFLRLDLWVTQDGTARADELLRLLDVDDLIEAGAVLERTAVELRDEVAPGDPRDIPPDGPADGVPLSGAEVAALAARLKEDENQQPAEAGTTTGGGLGGNPWGVPTPDWGASPNGPVVE